MQKDQVLSIFKASFNVFNYTFRQNMTYFYVNYLFPLLIRSIINVLCERMFCNFLSH